MPFFTAVETRLCFTWTASRVFGTLFKVASSPPPPDWLQEEKLLLFRWMDCKVPLSQSNKSPSRWCWWKQKTVLVPFSSLQRGLRMYVLEFFQCSHEINDFHMLLPSPPNRSFDLSQHGLSQNAAWAKISWSPLSHDVCFVNTFWRLPTLALKSPPITIRAPDRRMLVKICCNISYIASISDSSSNDVGKYTDNTENFTAQMEKFNKHTREE